MLILQVVGSICYAANKILLLWHDDGVRYRRSAWILYLLGVPFFTVLLFLKGAYIQSAVEFTSGFVAAYTLARTWDKCTDRVWLGLVLLICGLGIGTTGFASFNEYGFGHPLPYVESFSAAFFLAGTLLIHFGRSLGGWTCYLLMFICSGAVMLMNELYFGASVQVLSAIVAMKGIYNARRNGRKT